MPGKFYKANGSSILLTNEIGSGGEGRIFTIDGHPSHVAKIYHKQPSFEHQEKIMSMVQNPPVDPTINGPTKHPSIVWPNDVLYANIQKSQFAGFIMPRIQTKAFKKIVTYLSPDERLETFLGEFTWFHLFTTAFNLASCVAAIHEKGHCIGDLNESNFLVSPTTILTVIDCDSFQIRDAETNKAWRCPVGKSDYTAPEIMTSNFKDIDRTKESDCFALAIMIFQLLMEGTHPYSAKGKMVENLPTIKDKILKGIFPYGKIINNIEPPDYAPPFNILHPEIQSLFIDCFDKGYKNPSSRPSALKWMRVLKKIHPEMTKCAINPNHHFFAHLKACPWCERAKLRNKDSFQSSIGQQISLADPNTKVFTDENKVEYLLPYIKLALSDGIITDDEEAYIIEQGSKIQLSRITIKQLIDEEKDKIGAIGSSRSVSKLQTQQISSPISSKDSNTTYISFLYAFKRIINWSLLFLVFTLSVLIFLKCSK